MFLFSVFRSTGFGGESRMRRADSRRWKAIEWHGVFFDEATIVTKRRRERKLVSIGRWINALKNMQYGSGIFNESLVKSRVFFWPPAKVIWEGCHERNSATLGCAKVLIWFSDSWSVLVSEKKNSVNPIELIGKTSETKFWHFRCQMMVDEDQRSGLVHFFSDFRQKWMRTSCSPYENRYGVEFSRESDRN